jgi:hypothetical protein
VQIDGVDYVRCDLHGLIPLDHQCAEAPGDHWCRAAAHPNYDSEDADQAVSHRQWDSILTMKVRNWQRVAEKAVEALRVADLYLDGFVWVTEPEFSELRDIKRASSNAQKKAAALTESNGLTARQSAVLRGVQEPDVREGSNG